MIGNYTLIVCMTFTIFDFTNSALIDFGNPFVTGKDFDLILTQVLFFADGFKMQDKTLVEVNRLDNVQLHNTPFVIYVKSDLVGV